MTVVPVAGYTGPINLLVGVRDQTDRAGTGNLNSPTNLLDREHRRQLRPAHRHRGGPVHPRYSTVGQREPGHHALPRPSLTAHNTINVTQVDGMSR